MRYPKVAESETLAGTTAWRKVLGWTHAPNLYGELVRDMPAGGVFVELGCYMGRGLVMLAELDRKYGKGARIVGYDLWIPWVADRGASLEVATANVRLAGFDNVELEKIDTAEAAKLHADHSVHAVYVDADHTKKGCLRDIEAWRSKMAPGGVMAGDDWDLYKGVQSAVRQAFGDNFHLVPGDRVTQAWWVQF